MLSESKTRIKKTGVVDPEFTHHRIDRYHLCGEVGRDVNSFPGCQNIKLVWVENKLLKTPNLRDFPKIADLIFCNPIDVYYASEFLGFISDNIGIALSTQVHA